MHELYHLLEPNERVIYRARGAWVLNLGFIVLVVLLALVAMFFGTIAFFLDLLVRIGALTAEHDWVAFVDALLTTCTVLVVCAATLLAPVCYLRRFSRAEALVTDHRLLAKPFERSADLEVMSLAEIEAINQGSRPLLGSLEVTSRTGRTFALGPLSQPARFATALASAAGLGVPPKSEGASGLAALLEPGERLRYRDPRLWWPRLPLPAMVFIACLVGMSWLMLETSGHVSVAALTVLVMMACAYLQVVVVWKLHATTVAVSDRRVIYRSGGPWPEFRDIALAGIEAVHCETAGPGGSVTVTDRHDHHVPLEHLGDPKLLVEQVAEASGAQRPSFDSPIAWRGALAFGPAALLSMFALQHLVVGFALGASSLSLEEGSKSAKLVLGVLPFILAFPAGLYLGTLLAMASLRPRVAAEEMHAAITALKRRPRSDMAFYRWWLWALRKALGMWAALLYGRPPVRTDDGASKP